MQLTFDTRSAARQPLAWMLDTLNGRCTPVAQPMPARCHVMGRGQILVLEGGDAGPHIPRTPAMGKARVDFLAL